MKTSTCRFLVLTPLLSLILGASLFAGANDVRWHSGRVVSVSLAGHGSKTVKSKNNNAGKQDIWWTYCISGGTETYTAISRTGPGKGGMKVASPVKFLVDKNRIYVLNSKGERYILHRVSQGSSEDCR